MSATNIRIVTNGIHYAVLRTYEPTSWLGKLIIVPRTQYLAREGFDGYFWRNNIGYGYYTYGSQANAEQAIADWTKQEKYPTLKWRTVCELATGGSP